MTHNRLLLAVLICCMMVSTSLYSQQPLTNTMPAVGVLGTIDFVTNTNYTLPTRTTLAEPAGVAVDPVTGKLFVADRDNRRVLRYTSAAKLVNGSAAEAVFGQPDYVTRTANTGGISASTMNNPQGVYMDANGRLWVVDRDNNRVLRFDNASTKSSSAPADGVLGQPDFVTNSTGTTAAKMNAPAALYGDKNGRIWVADRANNRILRFDSTAAKANGSAANGVLGQPDFTTGTSGTTASTMNAPWGVTVDGNGCVWVADRSNSRVLRFDSAAAKTNGAAANGVLGQTTFTTSVFAKTQAGLGEPRGVAVDIRGRLYVADEGNTRIMVYVSAASKAAGANADYVLGQANFISDAAPNPPTATSLAYPLSLFIDQVSNNVWVPDLGNHRVLRFDIGPPVALGVLGTTDFVTNTSYTAPTIKTFSEPASVAVDPTTGKLFVADRDNRRVLRFSATAKLIAGSSAEAVFGQPDYVTRTANTGGISASSMNNPNAVSVDANGRLWVADRDNNRILRFDNASTKVSSVAADGVLGQPDFVTSTTGAAGGKMNAPACVFADANGRVWVADRANNRVLRFDDAAAKANGAAPNGVLGQDSYSSTTSGTTATTMSAPWGVTLDASGRLWVADRSNSRILRFDNAATKSNGAAADGVLGQTTFTGAVYAKTQAGLGEPRGVGFDESNGQLFVADEGNSRIMIYKNAASKVNGANADNIVGQLDFTSDAAPNPPTANSLNYPLSVCIDNKNGHFWIPDIYNHRILRYDAGILALTPNFAAVPKTISFGSVVSMTSKKDSIIVTNSGTAALQIDSVISNYSSFTISPSGVTSIASSGSQKYYITFAPTSAGIKKGSLVFFHNAAAKKDTINVDGTGTIGPIFTEDFISPAGTLLTAAGWTISGTSIVNPLTISAPGLTFGKYTGSGVGNALPMMNTGQDVFTTFPPVSVGSVYFSMMLRVDTAGTGDYFAALSPTSSQTNYFARLHVKSSGAGYMVGISKYNEVSGGAQYGTTVFNYKTTNLVVVKYTFTGTAIDTLNDPINVYVFSSTVPGAEPVTPEINAYVNAKTDAVNLGYVTLRQGGGAIAPQLVIDGLRIGTSWITAVPTGVKNIQADIPQTYELQNNYPNPFNPTTTIGFGLPEAGAVSLKIYDVLGREVATLVNSTLAAGNYKYNWNASGLASGMYIYRLSAVSYNGLVPQNFTQAKTLILQK